MTWTTAVTPGKRHTRDRQIVRYTYKQTDKQIDKQTNKALTVSTKLFSFSSLPLITPTLSTLALLLSPSGQRRSIISSIRHSLFGSRGAQRADTAGAAPGRLVYQVYYT